MKLGKIEKYFMNRPHHAKSVIVRAERLFQYIKLEENQKYLEVGCGNGAVTKYISKKYNLNATGIDIDSEQIQFAQKDINKRLNIRFLEADSKNLPFEEGEYEIVLSFGVMHHIPNWLDVLKEIKRVLKIKGYFIYFDLIFPNWSVKIGKLFQYKFGIILMRDLNSFFEKNNFSTIYSSMSTSLISLFNQYEAIYQKD